MLENARPGLQARRKNGREPEGSEARTEVGSVGDFVRFWTEMAPIP